MKNTFNATAIVIAVVVLSIAPAFGQANPEKILTKVDLATQPLVVANPQGESVLVDSGTYVISFSRMEINGFPFIRARHQIQQGLGYTLPSYLSCRINSEDIYVFQDKPGTSYRNEQEGMMQMNCAGKSNDVKISFVYVVTANPGEEPRVVVNNYRVK